MKSNEYSSSPESPTPNIVMYLTITEEQITYHQVSNGNLPKLHSNILTSHSGAVAAPLRGSLVIFLLNNAAKCVLDGIIVSKSGEFDPSDTEMALCFVDAILIDLSPRLLDAGLVRIGNKFIVPSTKCSLYVYIVWKDGKLGLDAVVDSNGPLNGAVVDASPSAGSLVNISPLDGQYTVIECHKEGIVCVNGACVPASCVLLVGDEEEEEEEEEETHVTPPQDIHPIIASIWHTFSLPSTHKLTQPGQMSDNLTTRRILSVLDMGDVSVGASTGDPSDASVGEPSHASGDGTGDDDTGDSTGNTHVTNPTYVVGIGTGDVVQCDNSVFTNAWIRRGYKPCGDERDVLCTCVVSDMGAVEEVSFFIGCLSSAYVERGLGQWVFCDDYNVAIVDDIHSAAIVPGCILITQSSVVCNDAIVLTPFTLLVTPDTVIPHAHTVYSHLTTTLSPPLPITILSHISTLHCAYASKGDNNWIAAFCTSTCHFLVVSEYSGDHVVSWLWSRCCMYANLAQKDSNVIVSMCGNVTGQEIRAWQMLSSTLGDSALTLVGFDPYAPVRVAGVTHPTIIHECGYRLGLGVMPSATLCGAGYRIGLYIGSNLEDVAQQLYALATLEAWSDCVDGHMPIHIGAISKYF